MYLQLTPAVMIIFLLACVAGFICHKAYSRKYPD